MDIDTDSEMLSDGDDEGSDAFDVDESEESIDVDEEISKYFRSPRSTLTKEECDGS